MSASKRAGTAWETLVVSFLRSAGWPHAERRALNGAKDRGDIAGVPLVVIECKAAKTMELGPWLQETHLERDHDGADIGVTWIKRRGFRSPAHGYVLMDGTTFIQLLKKAGYQ